MRKLNKILFFIALAVGLSSQSFANPGTFKSMATKQQ